MIDLFILYATVTTPKYYNVNYLNPKFLLCRTANLGKIFLPPFIYVGIIVKYSNVYFLEIFIVTFSNKRLKMGDVTLK